MPLQAPLFATWAAEIVAAARQDGALSMLSLDRALNRIKFSMKMGTGKEVLSHVR